MSIKQKSSKSTRSVNFSGSNLTESIINAVKSNEAENAYDVYLGFLKIFHKYAIKFSVPNEIGFVHSITCSPCCIGILVKDIQLLNNEIHFSLECTCEFKEGVVTDKFIVTCDETDKKLKIILHMEILGKNQGTPSLKNGVKCIEHLQSDDSDFSDYPS